VVAAAGGALAAAVVGVGMAAEAEAKAGAEVRAEVGAGEAVGVGAGTAAAVAEQSAARLTSLRSGRPLGPEAHRAFFACRRGVRPGARVVVVPCSISCVVGRMI
jgi:hypothetical protein